MADRADAALAVARRGDRWYRIGLRDRDLEGELRRRLTEAGWLVANEMDGVLCAALPGEPKSEAAASLRFFLGAWRRGAAAALLV